MPGLKIVIPTIFTDTTLPVLRDDAILPAAGALVLLDLTHPLAPLPSGVPASGSYLPNLAAEQLAALTGASPTSDTLKAQLMILGAMSGANGLLERSGKGGLHGILSQSAMASSSIGAGILLPAALKTYEYAHYTNDLYISVWSRVTRVPTTTNDLVARLATGGTVYRFAFANNPTNTGIFPSSNPALLGQRGHSAPRGPGGEQIQTVGMGDWVNGPPANVATVALAANWGGYESGNRVYQNKHASWVFYRCYIEDLTVSGRSYAEVDALDYALYTKHVLTSGGRYAGDTFTNPATIP